jgi:hypothetical protein
MSEGVKAGEREIGHTAMVFFHGIGNPRKLVTLAGFLDEFDKYGSQQNRHEIGIPRNFKHKVEEDSDGNSRVLVQFRRIKKWKDKDVQVRIIRAYEGYWGDDVTEGTSFISLLIWLIKILFNSLRICFSPWRRYPVHRVRSLHHIEDELKGSRTRQKLEALYRNFVSTQGVGSYPRGDFSDFQDFLNTGNVRKQYGDFADIAQKWRNRERNALLKLSVLLGFSLFIFLVILFNIFVMIRYAVNSLYTHESVGELGEFTIAAVAMAALIWLAWQPIKQRISDVIFWTTFDERSKGYAIREKRISQAIELISSVISNPRCNDCVIVGHSLGSVIAVEAMFRLAEKASALDLSPEVKDRRLLEFRKIKYLFLAGSPLENIFSLFQEDKGGSHRYSRIQEQKSPTLRVASFQDDAEGEGLKIINFWSRFDPISARIFSLRTPDNHRRKLIYNCESVPLGAPLPLPSHAGYFGDAGCMQIIYRAVMTGKYSEEQLPDEKLSLSLGFWLGMGIAAALILLLVQMIAILFGNMLVLIVSFAVFVFVSAITLLKVVSSLNRRRT